MKQRKSKQVRLLSGILIGIVMIAVLARIVYLNHCYPSPKVITYTENDTIKLGNYELKQTGWEWGDGSLLKENVLIMHMIRRMMVQNILSTVCVWVL